MKFLFYIERIALIRWSTLTFIVMLFLPLIFLRYGNTVALAQSALLIVLPLATAGLVFSHARVPYSYRFFSIHNQRLVRFTVKSVSLVTVINVCLTLLYGFAVGVLVNEPLSLHAALIFTFTSVVLSLACFALRLWVSTVVAWIVIIFFVVAGLPVSSSVFADSPILHAVVPTTWLLSGVTFASYVIPAGVAVAVVSAWLLRRAVSNV